MRIREIPRILAKTLICDNNKESVKQIELLNKKVEELSEIIKAKDNLISKLDSKLKEYEERDKRENHNLNQ